jgi:hypothetical protein
LAHLALKAGDNDRTLSSTVLSTATMVFGAIVYVALAVAAGPVTAKLIGS